VANEVNQKIIDKVNEKLCGYCERQELEMCKGLRYLSWCCWWRGCEQAKELYKKLKGGAE
jgi:hypothetical protein